MTYEPAGDQPRRGAEPEPGAADTPHTPLTTTDDDGRPHAGQPDPGRTAETYRTLDNLDELAATVDAARGMPMSGSCVVHRATVLDLIDETRAALPHDLVRARDALAERAELLHQAREQAGATISDARSRARAMLDDAETTARGTIAAARTEAEHIRGGASEQADELVGSARREGERVVSLARAEHERLLSETEVAQGATRRAEEIVSTARARAERLCADADAYVDEQLAGLGATLARMQHSVERGRQAVGDRPGAGDREPARVGATATPSARDEVYDFYAQDADDAPDSRGSRGARDST